MHMSKQYALIISIWKSSNGISITNDTNKLLGLVCFHKCWRKENKAKNDKNSGMKHIDQKYVLCMVLISIDTQQTQKLSFEKDTNVDKTMTWWEKL